MFTALSRLFRSANRSSSTRALPRRLQPALQLLEDRTTPAVTASVIGGVLIINLQAAIDSAALTYVSGTDTYSVSGNISAGALTGATSIYVRDTGVKATGQSFTVTSIGTLTGEFKTTGVETVTINAATGGDTTADGISITGATVINLNANLETNDAPVNLAGPVVLNADVTIDVGNGNVVFGSTVNSKDTTARALTIAAGTGEITFNSALGATNALGAITATADTIGLKGNITTTDGLVTLAGSVSLSRDVVVATGSGGIEFGAAATDTLDSDADATPRKLTISGTGPITFSGDVGTTSPLGTMTLSSTGAVELGGDVTVSNSSAVSFKGAVSLAANSTITTNGGNLTFQGAINSPTTARTLTVATGRGTATFSSTIGATDPLDEITITAGKLMLAGNITTDAANVALTGAVTLNGHVTIATNNGNVVLTGSVNSTSAGAKNLTLTAGTGNVTIPANVGGTKALAAFTVVSSDETEISSVVKAATVSVSADALIDVTAAAKVTGTTSTTLLATNSVAEIKISGQFVSPTINITGDALEDTVLTASNDANFTITGTGAAGTDDNGTLKRVAKGITSNFSFTNIAELALTGGTGANVFTFTDWKGVATIAGGLGSDTLVAARLSETVADFTFALSPTTLEFTTGEDYAISGIDVATLTGGATNDTFDVSDWIAPVRINGGTGINDLVWGGATDVALTGNSFVSGALKANLSGIAKISVTGTGASNTYSANGFRGELLLDGVSGTDILRVTANSDFNLREDGLVTGSLDISFFDNIDSIFLTGGASANTFTVSGYEGLLALDGVSGSDIYNIEMPATGVALVVTLADTGRSGKDTLTATPTGGVLTRTGSGASGTINRTGDIATPKRPLIDFTGIETVTSIA